MSPAARAGVYVYLQAWVCYRGSGPRVLLGMPVTTRSVHPAWGLGCAQICVRVLVSLCICHVCYGALLAGPGGRGLSLCLFGAGGGTHELATARTEWCVRV